MDAQTTLGNGLLTRTFNATLLEVQLQSQDNVGVGGQQTDERLDAPFMVTRGIVLPAGAEYTTPGSACTARPPTSACSRLNGRYETGGYYSGPRSDRAAVHRARAAGLYLLHQRRVE